MKNKLLIALIFGITGSTSSTQVFLENNYGARLNFKISSLQPEGQNIGNNIRVLLGDINVMTELAIRTTGIGSTYLSPYNSLTWLLATIKSEQKQHSNDDAVIAIEPSTSYTTWNVKLRWEPKGKIKSFEIADYRAIAGVPKVQPTPSQPLTQPAVTMDRRELEIIMANTADERLTLITNGALGADYARKATEICSADYTQAKKLGKIDLCTRLKTELLTPQYSPQMKAIKEDMAKAIKRGQRIVEVHPDLAPAIDDIKSSITRLHNSLSGYKARGEAQ